MGTEPSKANDRPVVFLAPDASRTGAPFALLHLLRWFGTHSDLKFRTVLYQDGPLAVDFSALAPTVILTEVGVGRSQLVRKIGKWPLIGQALKRVWHQTVGPRAVGSEPSLIYANSVASARLIRQMVPPGTPLIVHVHELEQAIKAAAGPEGMAAIKSCAPRYIAMSSPVRQNLIANHGIDPVSIDLIPAFIPIDENLADRIGEHGDATRVRLGIPAHALVIGGCGATSSRKGADLFVEMACSLGAKFDQRPLHFVWVGKVVDDEFSETIVRRVQSSAVSGVFHFVGEQLRPIEIFCGMDLFVLSSREEPMALVALEAASVGKPVVCFANAGGLPEFVGTECGKVISPMTGEALATGIREMLASAELPDTLGRRAFQKVRRDHHIDAIAPRILNVIRSMQKADGRCD